MPDRSPLTRAQCSLSRVASSLSLARAVVLSCKALPRRRNPDDTVPASAHTFCTRLHFVLIDYARPITSMTKYVRRPTTDEFTDPVPDVAFRGPGDALAARARPQLTIKLGRRPKWPGKAVERPERR